MDRHDGLLGGAIRALTRVVAILVAGTIVGPPVAVYPRYLLRRRLSETRRLSERTIERDLLLDNRLKCFRCRRVHWIYAEPCVKRSNRRCGQRFVDLPRDRAHQWHGRLARSEDALPEPIVRVRVTGFDRRWDIGQYWRTFRRADRQGAQLPAADEGQRGAFRSEGEIEATRHNLRKHLRLAAEWHVDGLKPGTELQPFHIEIARGADTKRAEGESIGLGFRRGDEVF